MINLFITGTCAARTRTAFSCAMAHMLTRFTLFFSHVFILPHIFMHREYPYYAAELVPDPVIIVAT